MRIIIDAGHGGNDTGAIGSNGTQEKDVVLSIAFKLKSYLEKYGIEPILTRNGDFYLSLNERIDISNKTDTAYFISIHCNSYVNPQAHGTEAYVYAKTGETYEFAKSLYNTLLQKINLVDRGIKEASFAVLIGTKMPAVLVEVAFLSNLGEEVLLVTDKFQEDVAFALAEGVGKYLGLEINNKPHWGQESINKLLKMGLITEPKDPEAIVSWAEFATVVLRMLEQ